MKKLESLFKFKNGLTLKNAIAMAPMTTYSGDNEGSLTEEEYKYYHARSHNVSMLITGTTYFTSTGKGFTGQFCGGCDNDIPQLKKLADTIKDGGAKPILQIFHAGRMTSPEITGEPYIYSASAIPFPQPGSVIPHELTDEHIEEIIQAFADVTLRAIKAGFAGIELHGANRYLIQQFFSPNSNQRNDKWGGSLENRARFPLAIVDAVLDTVKQNGLETFIVGYRLSPEEIEIPGISLDDTLYLIDLLSDKNLDYIHLSLARFDQTSIRDITDKRIVGKVVSDKINGRLPLIGVGEVWTRRDLEQAFRIYDLVAVGRALIADPEWLYKIQLGIHPDMALSLSKAAERNIPEKMVKKLMETKRIPICE